MPQEIYHIRRGQLVDYPRVSKPLASIALLPLEVLSNVFLFCLLQADGHATARNAPLVLTQVCSSWRKACLRIPQLWSTLSLSLHTTPTLSPFSPFPPPPPSSSSSSSVSTSPAKKSPQALANLASLWFERARHHLLSVSVNLTSTDITHPTDVSSALQPILLNAHSIRHLSIHITCASQLRDFFTSSEEPGFVNLESLSLSVQHVDITTPITTFRNSPRLSQVSFDLHGCPPSISLIHLPWSSLEVFEMTGASMLPSDTFQSLLASCINLQKASFWVDDETYGGDIFSTSTTPSVIITTIPNLKHLSISFYGRHEKTASSLLSSFNLPHLRHFHFFSGFITLPFLPSITSSTCLESLAASGVNITAAQFRALAIANPSLRSLILDLRYFKNEDIMGVLDVLATLNPTMAFPALENLSLWTRDISTSHSAAYLRMIQSRRGRSDSSSLEARLRFSLYLARRQHGVSCCRFGSCSDGGGSSIQLDDIFALADACEEQGGVDFYLKDVMPGEGIHDMSL